MNEVRQYRVPIFIGAGALIVALLLWAIFVSPQTSKLSSLKAQETQLQGQQTALQNKLTALKSEQQNLTKSCADLQRIATEIPSVQTPTDVDAEESSFESQFNGLAESSGVTLSQFSGFAPATTTQATPGVKTGATPGVVAVPTTLTVTGNYGQVTSFINGLDDFPRLFIIQTFKLSYGSPTPGAGGSAASAATPAGSSTGAAATPTNDSPPLWIGGTPTSPSAGPYSVSIVGSIYYTSTPNALESCTKAATAVH
jgi:Tfp pilus assembly protein PilO